MPFGTTADTLNNQEDYSGKFFLGTVVLNEDPEGLDRIKATVPELYPTLESCPWIGPSKFSSFGEGAGYGVYGSPKVGSQVLIVLQDGNQEHPIYLGSLLMSGKKTAQQKSQYHHEAWGFVDPSGNRLLVDMKSQTLTFEHSTKVKFVMKAGTLEVTTPQNHKWKVGGDFTADISGNARVTAGGLVEIQGSQIKLNGG
jgi:phage baseplate assembly protein gpV